MKKLFSEFYFAGIILFLLVGVAHAADLMAVREQQNYNEIILLRAPETWMAREIAGELEGFSAAENTILFKTAGYAQNPPRINNLYFKKRLGCSDDIVFFIDIKKTSDCCRYTAAIYVVPNRPATDFFKFVAPATFTKKSFEGIKTEILQYISQMISIKEGDWQEGRTCIREYKTPPCCKNPSVNILIDNSRTTIIDPMNYSYPYPH